MNLQNLPWWGRLLLFVILAGAVIYLGYKVYPNFTEIQKQIDGQQAELSRLQAEIQKGRGALKRRAELEAQIEVKEAELALLRRILPTEPETGDLVKWLKFQADQVNLDLLKFSRGPVKNKEFFNEHSYSMNVVADYHDLGKFFERVSGHDRLINIKNLTINANKGANRFSHSIRVNFNAVTYVYREETEAKP
jgi:type IV pilus assembly protein PilO